MEHDLNAKIGQKVLLLRKRRGYTTVQLARKVDLSQAQISRLENGKQGFRTETLDRLAEALGVATSYFLSDQDDTIVRAMDNPDFHESVRQAAARFLETGEPMADMATSIS